MEIKSNKIINENNNQNVDESIRLDSFRNDNCNLYFYWKIVEYNPHNYQSYFNNIQVVGEHIFVEDHNKIYNKILDISKNSSKIFLIKGILDESNTKIINNTNKNPLNKIQSEKSNLSVKIPQIKEKPNIQKEDEVKIIQKKDVEIDKNVEKKNDEKDNDNNGLGSDDKKVDSNTNIPNKNNLSQEIKAPIKEKKKKSNENTCCFIF